MVEIIRSTFELVNFEMPRRFPSGDTKEAVGFTRLELSSEVSWEIHIRESRADGWFVMLQEWRIPPGETARGLE